MSKAQQSDLKDVGGFVGGALIGGRRKASAVQFRDVVTLDFDNIPGWKTDDIIAACDKMMVSYCVYSTRKHCANKPRLRVVIPLIAVSAPMSTSLSHGGWQAISASSTQTRLLSSRNA